MFKTQYKSKNPYESWSTHGTYGSENAAIAAALQRKNMGAVLVRVINSMGATIYSS